MSSSSSDTTNRENRTRLAVIGLALAVGAGLMAVKFYAYHLTGSSAILSDALESIINVVASAFALGSVILAQKPPDASHPYGHGKIEYFSAGFEGALIIVAAVGIFVSGISHILDPRPLPCLESGLVLLAGAAVVNLALGAALLKYGRKTGSLTLIADGKHILTDVYTSAAVLPGLLVVRFTGLLWLDGVVACLVGVNILVSGGGLVRQSFSALMDASEPKLLDRISSVLDGRRKDLWIDIHQLRAWRSGSLIHIDLHLILPRNLSLEEAHREAKDLEALLQGHFSGRASILIHMDPCIDEDCPVCVKHLCELRSRAATGRPRWERERLVRNGASAGEAEIENGPVETGAGERRSSRKGPGDPVQPLGEEQQGADQDQGAGKSSGDLQKASPAEAAPGKKRPPVPQ
ncbi:Cation diffusion facilitator family transporter (modular protein) [uncultured Desulfatiglans sp.]|nr:Cation diffusion facilitator family transporter (modular protein) [uncultured Desulfatiglans sp.]